MQSYVVTNTGWPSGTRKNDSKDRHVDVEAKARDAGKGPEANRTTPESPGDGASSLRRSLEP